MGKREGQGTRLVQFCTLLLRHHGMRHEGRHPRERVVQSEKVTVARNPASDSATTAVAVQTAQLRTQSIHTRLVTQIAKRNVGARLVLRVAFSQWIHLQKCRIKKLVDLKSFNCFYFQLTDCPSWPL